MKHFLILIILAFPMYFGWSYMSQRERSTVKKFIRRHAIKVILIWIFIVAALFMAANNGSINLL